VVSCAAQKCRRHENLEASSLFQEFALRGYCPAACKLVEFSTRLSFYSSRRGCLLPASCDWLVGWLVGLVDGIAYGTTYTHRLALRDVGMHQSHPAIFFVAVRINCASTSTRTKICGHAPVMQAKTCSRLEEFIASFMGLHQSCHILFGSLMPLMSDEFSFVQT